MDKVDRTESFRYLFQRVIEPLGYKFTPDEELVEAVEWPDHPWGIGVQYHPEFKSTPVAPHPLFAAFVAACVRHAES